MHCVSAEFLRVIERAVRLAKQIFRQLLVAADLCRPSEGLARRAALIDNVPAGNTMPYKGSTTAPRNVSCPEPGPLAQSGMAIPQPVAAARQATPPLEWTLMIRPMRERPQPQRGP